MQNVINLLIQNVITQNVISLKVLSAEVKVLYKKGNVCFES